MPTPGFDGSAYRREVLATLREQSAADVQDLFWLVGLPREVDDQGAITAQLKQVRGFLNKEKSRPRQATVAAGLLEQWPRIEATLLDSGSRRALRTQLGEAKAGPKRPAKPTARRTGPVDREARKRRQVRESLDELGRLRDDPDVGTDLFAFLGLPLGSSQAVVAQRVERVAEVNRRRRPDRERAVIDDLLIHARDLLVQGDPAAYQRALVGDRRDAVVEALLNGDIPRAERTRQAAHAENITDAEIIAGLTPHAAEHNGALPVSALGLGTWCASCGHIVTTTGACSNCHADLAQPCPNCRRIVAVDLPSCPSCHHDLDALRAPLQALRAERRAEEAALSELETAPDAELEQRLITMVAAHPSWKQAKSRLSRLPPAPPSHLRITARGDEAELTWSASVSDRVDQYIVARIVDGREQVLGHTAMVSWHDSPPAGEVIYSIRALRAGAVSEPARAPLGAGLRAITAIPGPPIRLAWSALTQPPRITRVERRPEGDVTRHLAAGVDGYVDRHVGVGRTYEYLVTNDADPADSWALKITAGHGEAAKATPARQLPPSATSSRQSSPPQPAPATRQAPPAPAASPKPDPAEPPTLSLPSITDLAARRDDDGRVRLRFRWPVGITEVQIRWHPSQPPAGPEDGHGGKVTNTRYDIDGGALLDDVPTGVPIAVFTGRRDGAGTLRWGTTVPEHARTLAP